MVLLFLFKKGPKIKIIEKDNTSLIEELNQYKDLNGNLVSKITQLEFSKKEVESRVDSIAKELKLSKGKIITVDHYHTSVDTQFYPKPIPVYKDKDTLYKVTQKDEWLLVEAVAGKDTGYIHLQLTDELDRIEEYKPGFLGLFPKTNIYLRSKSPYINYSKGYSFTVKEKTTFLTIGPSIQYNLVGPYKNKTSVGVSIQIPLIKIKK